MGAILIAGGECDPNLATLISVARQMKISTIALLPAPDSSPAFEWTLPANQVLLDGKELKPSGAFIRYDVFSGQAAPHKDVGARCMGWFSTVQAWVSVNPIKSLNRSVHAVAAYKPAVLHLAHEVGLRVATTHVTNVTQLLAALDCREGWIVKPVAGGDYCRELAEPATKFKDLPNAAMPAIVQRRMAKPELRVYIINATTVAFELESDSLDYREHQDVRIEEVPCPPELAERLRRLMAGLGMNFGAADFKRDPESGEWTFLELNTSPMFARFDIECGSKISEAIISALC